MVVYFVFSVSVHIDGLVPNSFFFISRSNFVEDPKGALTWADPRGDIKPYRLGDPGPGLFDIRKDLRGDPTGDPRVDTRGDILGDEAVRFTGIENCSSENSSVSLIPNSW
jgi:hypothetical protein